MPKQATPKPMYTYGQLYFQDSIKVGEDEVRFSYASPKFVADSRANSRLGFKDVRGNLFVLRDLKPATVPFAVTFLHYNSLTQRDFKERFGFAWDSDVHGMKFRDLVLKVVLDNAYLHLSNSDLQNLIDRVEKEPYLQEREPRDIIGSFRKRAESPVLLVGDVDGGIGAAREEHYLHQYRRYAEALSRSHYIRMSRELYHLQETYGAGSVAGLPIRVARCERTFEEIMNDEDLRENLPGLIGFARYFQRLVVGDSVLADPLESRMGYLCENVGVGKLPPVKVVNAGPEHPLSWNKIVVARSGRHVEFFESLERRLLMKAMEEITQLEALAQSHSDESHIIGGVDIHPILADQLSRLRKGIVT